MRNKILQLIANKSSICLTSLFQEIPEIKGQYSMYLPVKEGCNPNVLMIGTVTEFFIEEFNYLSQNKIIEFVPVDVAICMIDGAAMYGLPIANMTNIKKTKKELWLPLLLKRGENFPDNINKQPLIDIE